MNQIILASHGGMSAGVLDTVEMILGKQSNLYAIATTRDETESIKSAARRLLKGFSSEDRVYILTDLIGGSANNDMLSLLVDYPEITVICGMNACLALNMVLETVSPIPKENLEDYISQAREQIIDCTAALQKVAIEEMEDDL